ncbi:hypothetical protein [Amycolatopsis sp. NPDC059657]|uniref:hypothetical protein n=1 Tax=Amycolatopsis sp. NPDC059657 TaxID=3346899 RepID=UPI0036706A75
MDTTTTRSVPHSSARLGQARPPAGPQAARRDRPAPSTPSTGPMGRSGRRREPTNHRPAATSAGPEVPAITDLDQLAAPARADSSPPPWSCASLLALGVTTDLLTAARILCVGRTKAYQLAKSGDFPVPATRIGRRYVVAVAHIAELLGLEEKHSS